MFSGSRTHAHQSEFASFGAPGPMSPWKPAVATPQRKFLGSFAAAAAGTADTTAAKRASSRASRAMPPVSWMDHRMRGYGRTRAGFQERFSFPAYPFGHGTSGPDPV